MQVVERATSIRNASASNVGVASNAVNNVPSMRNAFVRRRFLSLNYPPLVLKAFDSLVPGGLRADLFKLCVLLLHGGVWADIDVLLETNLEKIISDNSFVGVVGASHKGQAFCVHNGFVAATPNHPFIKNALGRLVTNVLNRFDEIDVTREFLCGRAWNGKKDAEPKIWHTRSFPLSYMTGSCNLGLGIKKTLGLNAFASIKPGILKDGDRTDVPGRTLFLKMHSRDFGAWRACDEDGHVVVATNFNDFDEMDTFCKNGKRRFNCGDHTAGGGVDGLHHTKVRHDGIFRGEERFGFGMRELEQKTIKMVTFS